jgi:hypothetical protein
MKKGGSLFINPASGFRPDQFNLAIRDWIEHVDECVLRTNTSAFGTIFTLRSTSTSLVSVNINRPTQIQIVTHLILKIGYIGQQGDPDIVVLGQPKYRVLLADFNREVALQRQVYANSLDTFFDPICPHLIYEKTHILGQPLNWCFTILNRNPQLAAIIATSSIAIMIMELGGGGGALPVEDVFQLPECRPEWGPDTPTTRKSNKTYADRDRIDNIVMINYAYQLIRLQALGIHHGDSHLGNAMYVPCHPDVPYYGGYKVFLLDFGQSTAIPQAERNNVNFGWHSRREWWSYEAIARIYQLLQAGTLPINTVLGPRTVGIVDFIQEMKLWRRNSYLRICMLISQTPARLTAHHALVERNIQEFPRLGHMSFLINYRNANDENSKQWLFSRSNVDRRAMAITVPPEQAILLNDTLNCCRNPDTNRYYNYLSIGSQYRGSFIDGNARLVTLLHRIIFMNQELLGAPDGYYLWVIGSDAGNRINLFTINIAHPSEIGTKHYHLMRYYGIQNYYLAGELEKNGNTISFNLVSGTFMRNWLVVEVPVANINTLLTRYGHITMIFLNSILFNRANPITIRNIPTTYDPVTGFLNPTFIVPDNQRLCRAIKNTRVETGLPAPSFATTEQCVAAPKPNTVLVGGSQQDDIDLAKNSVNLVFSSLLYDDLIEIPNEIIDYIKKDKKLQSNFDMLQKLVAIIKHSDIMLQQEESKESKKEKTQLRSGLTAEETTYLREQIPTPKTNMVAGKKSRKLKHRKLKNKYSYKNK